MKRPFTVLPLSIILFISLITISSCDKIKEKTIQKPTIPTIYTPSHSIVNNSDGDSYDYETYIYDSDDYYDESESYEPETRYVECQVCYGLGTCQACYGSGIVYRYSVYSGGEYLDCPVCNGSCRCPMCDGSGYTEYIGW